MFASYDAIKLKTIEKNIIANKIHISTSNDCIVIVNNERNILKASLKFSLLLINQLKQKLVNDIKSAQQEHGKERDLRYDTKTTQSANLPYHYSDSVATLPTLDNLWRI